MCVSSGRAPLLPTCAVLVSHRCSSHQLLAWLPPLVPAAECASSPARMSMLSITQVLPSLPLPPCAPRAGRQPPCILPFSAPLPSHLPCLAVWCVIPCARFVPTLSSPSTALSLHAASAPFPRPPSLTMTLQLDALVALATRLHQLARGTGSLKEGNEPLLRVAAAGRLYRFVWVERVSCS